MDYTEKAEVMAYNDRHYASVDPRERQKSETDTFTMEKPPSVLYHPIPTVMKMYYQWNLAGLKYYHVCGTNERERIFTVDVHTGHSFSGPLGMKPGMYLLNGPSHKDTPVIAAIGQDTVLCGLTFSRDNIIYLPSTDGQKKWDTERMRARTTPKPDNNIHFCFSVDVGGGRRERFEWRKVMKSERDESTPHGGFKLLWMSAENHDDDYDNGGPSTGDDYSKIPVVAVFSWNSFFDSPKHPYDLTLTGDERFMKLGERCFLMVLITALGLHWLNINGLTGRGPVSMVEKVKGTGKEGS
ncbi:hypothetical protein GGS20DRAFT_313991 [Poronia punctata]|nr:hypothetical protein GGS20DRAFT_313991 [Poronia punctata]